MIRTGQNKLELGKKKISRTNSVAKETLYLIPPTCASVKAFLNIERRAELKSV